MKMKSALLAAVVLGAMLFSRPLFSQDHRPFWQEAKGGAAPLVGNLPSSFAPLAEKVSPAVVTVYSSRVLKAPAGPEFFFFGIPKGMRQEGVGSGFILTEDGYVLTNNHVVADMEKVKVMVGLDGKKEYTAEVVGADPKTDVALIKISATGLPTVALGDSDQLRVGDWVAAIGSPFGFGHTLTVGVVSAKGRRLGIGPYDDFIQTDASINRGNSGGPLVNLSGEVVGINSVIIAPAGGNVGVGFAIPINLAKSILTQLKEKGKVERSWLGVSVQEVTPELAESFGMKQPRGALVAQVIKGSPAEKAGLEPGDVIIAFAGAQIESSSDLPAAAALYGVGRKAEIKVLRNGKEETRSLTLEAMPEEKELAARMGPQGSAKNALGLSVKDLTPETAEELGYQGLTGVVVVAVDSNGPAGQQDIQQGDLIQRIDRTFIRNVEDFDRVAGALRSGRMVRLYIRRGDASLFLAFPLPGGK